MGAHDIVAIAPQQYVHCYSGQQLHRTNELGRSQSHKTPFHVPQPNNKHHINMKLSLQTVILTYLTLITMAAAMPTPQPDDFQLDIRDNIPQVRSVAEETTLVAREPFNLFKAIGHFFKGD